MSDGYYSCQYLLTLKDAKGNHPDIYISDGNRTAGKSVSWKKKLVDDFSRLKMLINSFTFIGIKQICKT